MTRKSCSGVDEGDVSCALKNLNDDSFALNLNDTSLSDLAVVKADIDDFLVGNALYAVNNNQ